uniref:Homeobox domain-containing protein n=1 Tax=Globisporangium ultimum (strain ATCC 200006 / CBS 805.95 / DAOM BR144) TaxID=431595 RepID=K3WAE9_GLOUD
MFALAGAGAARIKQEEEVDDDQMDAVKIEREAHHELLPLIQKLKHMIAHPDKLFAALTLIDIEDGVSFSERHQLTLKKKTIAYQRSELRGLAATWHRFVDAVGSPSSKNSYLKRVDHMMMKLALYHMRLWNYICAICIDAVLNMGAAVAESQKHWFTAPSLERHRPAASISPMFESKSSDALSQGMIRASSSNLAKRSRLTRHSNEFMIGWFIAHKANPYPSAEERTQIASKTGLTEQQVRNWFANMRKRHWKPNRLETKKPRCLLDVVLRKHEV